MKKLDNRSRGLLLIGAVGLVALVLALSETLSWSGVVFFTCAFLLYYGADALDREDAEAAALAKSVNRAQTITDSSPNLKYVWFNLDDGTFSETWNGEDHCLSGKDLADTLDGCPGAKLIRYECLTDTNFEFCHLMKVVTNTQRRHGSKQ